MLDEPGGISAKENLASLQHTVQRVYVGDFFVFEVNRR
jgi:hypothetical protein